MFSELVFLALDYFRLARDVSFPSDVLICSHASPLKPDMQVCQVAEEEQSTEVEEACDADDDLEFNQESALVDLLLRLNRGCRLCGQVVYNEAIGHIVHKRHQKDKTNQSEEQVVIGLANTVIQPATVVIKIIHTSVTSAAMFG